MLVNGKKVLADAKAGKYGVPAPDYLDLDSARVFVRTAEELGKPVILSYPQLEDATFPLEEAAAVGKLMAERVKVPVVLHLDHGEDFDFLRRSIDLGFTSVMIDASSDSFEENVRKTKEVVAYARQHNVTVEAEIGHVGHGENLTAIEENESVYTTVEEAKKFAELTGVDSLAVSIGTVHGIYKNLATPQLNFQRLAEIAAAVPVPLVLHGGSGTGDDNLARCCREGICKVNIFTDFLTGAMKRIQAEAPKGYPALKECANAAMAEVLRHYYGVFGTK